MKVCFDLPRISILVTTYNNQRNIKECIESILAQTYSNFEIIVIDDCSVDATVYEVSRLLENFRNFKLVVNKVNLGYTKSFNLGLEYCSGEFICFCDGDDFLAKNKLQLQYNFLKFNSQKVVGTSFSRIQSNGSVYENVLLPSNHDHIIESILSKNNEAVCGSSIMISKEVINDVGGYSLIFNRTPSEDIDWILRISKKYTLHNLDDCLYYYRFDRKSLTRRVHYSIRKRYSLDLAIDLYKNGRSFSDISYKSRLINIRNTYISNRSELYLTTSIQHSINSDFCKSLNDLRKVDLNKVDKRKLLKVIVINLILIIFPINILLTLKSYFGLKHISNV